VEERAFMARLEGTYQKALELGADTTEIDRMGDASYDRMWDAKEQFEALKKTEEDARFQLSMLS
jgi:hypothetical protein